MKHDNTPPRRSPSRWQPRCSASPAPIAIAEDSELIVFDWSGYEDPDFHPGYVDKHGDVADLHLLRRRGRSLREDALRLQDRPRPSLLAERREMARGRAAAAARHLARSPAGTTSMPGIMAMKNLATTADGTAWFMPWDWGNTLLTYQHREDRRQTDIAVAEGLRRSEVQGPRLDRRQCRRRLCAGARWRSA